MLFVHCFDDRAAEYAWVIVVVFLQTV